MNKKPFIATNSSNVCAAGGSPACVEGIHPVNPVIPSKRRTPSFRKQGAAIVELVMGMLLLLSMIAFTVFVCRAMSQRNRALAASRTVAWLYTHADEPDGGDNVWTTTDFRIELARWHFNHSDPNRVVVTNWMGKGLISKEGGGNRLLNAIQEAKNSAVVSSEVSLDETGYQEQDKEPIPSPSGFVASAAESFMTGAINFITGDFKYCTAQVRASTPLIFGTGFYQLFGWFTDMDEGTKDVMLNPSFSGSCTMPMQEGGNGIQDPFSELAETLQGAMKSLQSLVEDTQEDGIYRPCRIGEESVTGEDIPLDKNAFYALLVFEIDEPIHDPLKSDGSASWEGGAIELNSESHMNALLNLCGIDSQGNPDSTVYEKKQYQTSFY